MSDSYLYDAFISYRHRTPDADVAKRLQQLLESYRPPKSIAKSDTSDQPSGSARRKFKIFRDSTELPTSGDLDDALSNALLSSRFLIVVLSEETVNSKWCMAEIRAFKEAHGGRISHILPVIVSGEPNDILPPELRSEIRLITQSDGNTVSEDTKVEPLCADVRAGTKRAIHRNLRTEFLRVAAALLGCGYDDLYRRQLRGQRRVRTAVFTGLTALAVAFGAMAVVIYRTEIRYEQNLVDTYTQQGSSRLEDYDDQEAMVYFAKALALDNKTPVARSGAFLLLQNTRWPYLTDKRTGSLAEMGLEHTPHTTIGDDYIAIDVNNKHYVVPRPKDLNPAINQDAFFVVYALSGNEPDVSVGRNRALVVYGDYAYIHSLEHTDNTMVIDIAAVFPDLAENNTLCGTSTGWISDDGNFLALWCNGDLALVNLEKAQITMNYSSMDYRLNKAVFSGDSKKVALLFGNSPDFPYQNPGGFMMVCDIDGSILMKREPNERLALQDAAFSPDNKTLVAWSGSNLHFYDVENDELYARDLNLTSVRGAAFDNSELIVDDGRGHVYNCGFNEFTVDTSDCDESVVDDISIFTTPASQELWTRSISNIYNLWVDDDLHITSEGSSVSLIDKNDAVLAQNKLDNEDSLQLYIHKRGNKALLWTRNETQLYCVPFDTEGKTLGDTVEINTLGYPVIGVCAAGDGVIVVTGAGRLLYYEDVISSEPHVMHIGQSGQVESMAVNDSGQAALIIRDASGTDQMIKSDGEIKYGIELWNYENSTRIAMIENDCKTSLSSIAFDHKGFLVYKKGNKKKCVRVDVSAPDAATVAFLSKIPCLELGENQLINLRAAEKQESVAGNWGDIVTVSNQ